MRDRELFEREIGTLLPGDRHESVFHEMPPGFKEQVTTGTTLYADLKLDRARFPAAAKTIPEFKQVGLFATTSAKKNEYIDVYLFLHGHVTECGIAEKTFQKEGIQGLWNQKAFVTLRRDLEASGRTAMLIVPKLDAWVGKKKGAAGWLHLEKEDVIRALIAAAWDALEAAGAVDPKGETHRKFLAALGAGGEPMQKIIGSKAGSMFDGCVGFESIGYGVELWRVWGHCSGRLFLDHYRTKGWNEKIIAAEYKGSILDTVAATAGNRCDLVDKFWARALNKQQSSWIEPIRQTTPAKKSHEMQFDNAQDLARQGAAGATRGGAGAVAPFVLKTLRPLTTPTKLKYTSKAAKEAFNKFRQDNPAAPKAQWPEFVQVQQAPSVFMRTILTNARTLARTARDTAAVATLDPDVWFTQFTRIKFLGRDFNGGEYVHLEFAKKLREVETALVTEVGGTAQSVGDLLLNNRTETHAASRLSSLTAAYSYHMFGLAIDVNYLGDPLIEKGSSAPTVLSAVLRNASALLRTDTLTFTYGHGAAHYDVVARLDQLLESYFALLDSATALRTALTAATRAPWRGMSERAARIKIQGDLDRAAAKASRLGWKKPHFKSRALLDFDRRLVVAMTNAGLDWGAWYGDMMHFDMRTNGVGAYIETAKEAHKSKAGRQYDRLLAARDYGYHEFVD